MRTSYRVWGVVCALVLVAALGYAQHSQANKSAELATTNVIHVRWLLAHQPTDVFLNAEKAFAETLTKESGGQMSLEVLTPEQAGFTGEGDIPYAQTLDYLNQHKAEVSSVYTAAAAMQVPSLGVINMPYLFTDYASASKVFDSGIGEGLMESYNASSTVHAMAFTYSGGYRIIASNKKTIHSLEDLKGLRVATSGGKTAEAFLSAAGAVPVTLDLESGSAELASIDAIETTYSRLSEVVGKNSSFTKYITDTNHSLFTTMLVVDDSFFNSLTPLQQTALEKAAAAAANVERTDSIALGAKTRAMLLSSGSTIATPAEPLNSSLKSKATGVYTSFPLFSDSTVAAIRVLQQ